MRAAIVVGVWLLALPALGAGPVAPKIAAAPKADADAEARADFTAGRYADALVRYERLYADTHHPTYLRNIGRCHQMLEEPEAAIANLREYLRVASSLSPGARTEVEGFIREMEDLKRRRADEAATRAGAPAPRPEPPAAPAPPPPDHRGADFETGIATRPAAPPPGHGWVWAAGGAVVVAAGVVAAVLLLRSPRSACPDCTLPTVRIDAR
jgi:hypothetical protein